MDLHQQFDILSLGEAGFQLAVIDALASNANMLGRYQLIFRQLQQNRRQLEQLKEKQAMADKESDYHKFLFSELDEASLKENEFEEAETLLKRQSHSEAIKSVLSGIDECLRLSEQPIVSQIKSFGLQLEPFRAYHEKFPEIIQRFNSIQIELQDLAMEMESVNDDIQYDAEQIEKLNERVHTGYKLFKKHHVSATTDLIDLREQLKNKLSESLNIAEEISAKEKTLEGLVRDASAGAVNLSTRRSGTNGRPGRKS